MAVSSNGNRLYTTGGFFATFERGTTGDLRFLEGEAADYLQFLAMSRRADSVYTLAPGAAELLMRDKAPAEWWLPLPMKG